MGLRGPGARWAAVTASLILPTAGAIAVDHGHTLAAGGAPAVVIRVDQVGYPIAGSKVAHVMSASPIGSFTAALVAASGIDSGHVVQRIAGGASTGAWSTSYPDVYPVDFTSWHGTGEFRLRVRTLAGTAVSPPFHVEQAGRLYRQALRNALSFYENERNGPHYIPSALRTAPAHLNDEHAQTYRTPPMNGNGNFAGSLAPYSLHHEIDAAGGWFDAGDYLQFVETTSYAVTALETGIVQVPAAMRSGKEGAAFGAEARFGIWWLEHMWDERTKTLYYQLGIGEANRNYVGDHDIWRLPQADDTYGGTTPADIYIRHPPVFRAGPAGAPVSPNLAGRLVAAFALCYRIERATAPDAARRCLRDSRTVFSLAGTDWKGRLLTTAPWSFYPESSWRDDMALGATELSLALHEAGRPAAAAKDLRLASHWARRYALGDEAGSDTLNLYDVSSLAYYELAHALAVEPHPSGLEATRSDLVTWFRDEIEIGLRQSARDPFGFGFAWDQWDTTTHGAGLSVMASLYDSLVHRPVFAAAGARWLGNVLGDNAWGVSLVVGDGTAYPDCMQHQIANLQGSLDGQSPILAGAAVEGPNSYAARGKVTFMRTCRGPVSPTAPGNPYAVFNGHHAVYDDNVQSYSTNEPAIDLTALTPLAFAWRDRSGR